MEYWIAAAFGGVAGLLAGALLYGGIYVIVVHISRSR
jgi:hypothetical protein